MQQDVYGKLAKRLDAIPNGFPQSQSGAELKLLARMFTPEEAALASEMKMTPETPEAIAGRIGMDAAATRGTLMAMARKGLIRLKRDGGNFSFGLIPFVVGAWEAQVGNLDKEGAALFEEYYETFSKGVLDMQPSLHVVIPVEKSIPFTVQIFPYEQASQLLENSKSFGVQKCICRLQKSLIGKPCKHTMENCLVFAPVEGAFQGAPEIRTITKEEAFDILRKSEEEGLIHSSSNWREGKMYICNCCSCCCGIMQGLVRYGIENSMAKSDFFAVVDSGICAGCDTCSGRCHFGAIAVAEDEGISHVNKKRCAGCGQCVVGCPSNAISLVRKQGTESSVPPKDMTEWMVVRAKNRGISMQNII